MWIIILILLVVGFFFYNSFKTRCPKCGYFAMNRKDKESINYFYAIKQKDHPDYEHNKKMDELMSQFSELGSNFAPKQKLSNDDTPFICNKCDYHFDRRTAKNWANIAYKLSEQKALTEFNKLNSENK